MSSILLTPPALEPISVAEAKAYLRVEHDDDDDVIAALIAGSRIHIEAQTRLALMTQTWRLSLDAWPADGALAVRPAPLPAPVRAVGGIEIDVETGYGEAAADVPEPLRQAIRMLVAHWYENRGVVASGGTTWSTFSMSDCFTSPSPTAGIHVLEGAALDISGQPSGSSMKWRARTANNKNLELHDIYLAWE